MTGKRMKVRISFILCLITTLILFVEGSVLAKKDAEFRLDIDSLNLEEGVSTNLVFSIINANGCKDLVIDGLDNFDVLSTNQSTSTRIINGDATSQIDVNYILMPKKAGKFTLQGSINYKGDTRKTNTLEVNVREKNDDVNKEEIKNLFLKTLISDDEIYFGQKIGLTYELYSRYNIVKYGFVDQIGFDDFIVNEVSDDDLKGNFVIVDGNKYVKYEAKKMYLSPIKTGKVTIPSYKFQANIATEDFFNSSKPVYLGTTEKELTIKPLPEDNKPDDFSGLVGDLKIEANYNKNQLEYGDSLTLNVTASGNCNLEILDKIIKDELPGFSVYETVKGMEESIENNQYKAKKEFEIILVPEKNGDIEIEPIYLSYFDTVSETYKRTEIPGTTITVNGEMPENQQPNQGNKIDSNKNVATEKVKITQVSYNADDKDYVTLKFSKSHLLIALIVLIVLIVLVLVLLIIRAYTKKQDKELNNIYKRLKSTDKENDLYNLLNDMIKHHYDISLKANSKDYIKNMIKDYEVADLVVEVTNYMETKKNGDNRDNKYLKEKIKEIYIKIK
ncbi:hypothetical protein AN1V17_02860 [Vallitalea sediminicola]